MSYPVHAMKTFHAILPFLLMLAIVGCASESADSSDSRQDLESQKRELEAEKRALEASRQELERQNAALVAEKEQREAAERAKREEEERTYPPDIVAGIWSVRMTCIESDCSGFNPKDVFSETWNISYQNGQYQINVINGAPNTNKSYTGDFNGKYFRAGFTHTDGGWGNTVSAKVSLIAKMRNENIFEGRREVLKDSPCKIAYSITGKRAE